MGSFSWIPALHTSNQNSKNSMSGGKFYSGGLSIWAVDWPENLLAMLVWAVDWPENLLAMLIWADS